MPQYFRLLSETGAMPHELHKATLREIDMDKGTIAIQGLKGHSSRIFKLKSETLAMLKTYLKEHGNKEPLFPNSKSMWKAWLRVRNILAEKLKEPQLRTIRLYDLRHYYATMTYYKTKDILYVKQQLGHKKLETTLIYTQLVNFAGDEYTVRTAETVKQPSALLESGFEYVAATPQEVMLFRKRK